MCVVNKLIPSQSQMNSKKSKPNVRNTQSNHPSEDNAGNESSYACVASLGRTAKITNYGMVTNITKIASDLAVSERTESVVNEGLANIVLSLLEGNIS